MPNGLSQTDSLQSAADVRMDGPAVPSITPPSGRLSDSLSGPDDVSGINAVAGTFSYPYPYPLEEDCDCDPDHKLPGRRTTGDPYYFYGSMSQDVLNAYLDKSIEMCSLSYSPGGSALAHSGLRPSPADRANEINMIRELGAKFVIAMVSFWPPWDTEGYLTTGLTQFKADVDAIHAFDSDVICDGIVFEIVGEEVSIINIPGTVFQDFGKDAPASDQPFFDYNINYSPSSRHCADFPRIDITRLDAQMWYYYMATRLIDSGAESIDFGDIYEICCQDVGNAAIWKVVNLVRNYAAGTNLSNTTGLPNARRGMVLCFANSYYNPGSNNTMYYDPTDPITGHLIILPPWQRQLIFDFHQLSIGGYVKPDLVTPCTADFLPVVLDPTAPYWVDNTVGGLHPQGWYCIHSACMVFWDNSDIYTGAGCGWYMAGSSRDFNKFWGYDAATWFLMQSSDYRDKIIAYFYYGLKCINPYTRLYMPGKILSSKFSGTGSTILAYTANDLGQQDTIAAIWNGPPTTPYEWLYHNFTIENVADTDLPPSASLIYAGDDKMYFIAQDGYVHGYIKVSGDNNDGTWLTVSPSYAADVPAGSQVKAKSDLVASPDGKKLLYIGVDGYIYGFRIVDVWSYQYIGFIRDEMRISGPSSATCCLIFPGDGNIFYIGNSGAWENSVLGWKINWDRNSCSDNDPSYIAALVHGASYTSQFQAAGALTYDANTNRLYYRPVFDGAFGTLAYYEIFSSFSDFIYAVPGPANDLLRDSQLAIQGNLAINYDRATNTTRIYFVGRILSLGWLYIYCLIETPSGWSLVSPSISSGRALTSTAQSDPAGNIAVSPDGSTIAYWGEKIVDLFYVAPFILYFRFDGINYHYSEFGQPPLATGGGNTFNSLQFINNTDLYFINTTYLYYSGVYFYAYVLHLKYQEAFCENPAVTGFP